MNKKLLLITGIALALAGCNDEGKSESAAPKVMTGRDGKIYKTVSIGGQVWMAQNMNTQVPDSWCYEDKETNCEEYGRLYTWEAAMKVCPEGWALPSNEDWETMKAFVETQVGAGKAGAALKSRGTTKNEESLPATDKFGFGAQIGGDRVVTTFKMIGDAGFYWSSSDDDASHAYDWVFSHKSDDLVVGNIKYGIKKNGFSVRCIQKTGVVAAQQSDVKATFTDDRDNKTYQIVKIGSQKWFAENLAYKTSSSKCYQGKSSNCGKYGQFYTWTDAMQIAPKYATKEFKGQGVIQGVCPDGWHLPSKGEWDDLIKNIESKTNKEKVWINLLSKDETLVDYYLSMSLGMFFDGGECEGLSGKACAEKVFKIKGTGNKNVKEGYSHYIRTRGTNMYGFNARIVGSAFMGDAEDSGAIDYTAFWTSTDGFDSKSNRSNFYISSAGNINESIDDDDSELKKYMLPVRCVAD